ncbi:UNVERIFIED_CONTAM: hypothetical protein RKD43_000487 [Streptomyces graminofaciens]
MVGRQHGDLPVRNMHMHMDGADGEIVQQGPELAHARAVAGVIAQDAGSRAADDRRARGAQPEPFRATGLVGRSPYRREVPVQFAGALARRGAHLELALVELAGDQVADCAAGAGDDAAARRFDGPVAGPDEEELLFGSDGGGHGASVLRWRRMREQEDARISGAGAR